MFISLFSYHDGFCLAVAIDAIDNLETVGAKVKTVRRFSLTKAEIRLKYYSYLEKNVECTQ